MGQKLAHHHHPKDCHTSKGSTNTNKVVLVGAGDSGKTTLINHLRFLSERDSGNPDDLLREYSNTIRKSVTVALEDICKLILKSGDMGKEFDTELIENASTGLIWLRKNVCGEREPKYNSYYISLMEDLWTNELVQKHLLEKRNSHSIFDNFEFFFEERERIIKPDYSPTKDDLLMHSVKSIGISEYTMRFSNKELTLVDTGGQRNERSKWKRVVEDASIIVFTVSLADFYKNLFEDSGYSRHTDSLLLFENFVKDYFVLNQCHQHVPLVVIFTKQDLLKRKITELRNQDDKISKYLVGVDIDDDDDTETCRKKVEDYILQEYKKIVNNLDLVLKCPFHIVSNLIESEVRCCMESIESAIQESAQAQ